MRDKFSRHRAGELLYHDSGIHPTWVAGRLSCNWCMFRDGVAASWAY